MKDSLAHSVEAAVKAIWDVDDAGTTDLQQAMYRMGIQITNGLRDLELVGTWCDILGEPDDRVEVIGTQHVTDREDKVFFRQFRDTSILIATDHSIIETVGPVSW